MGGQERGGVGGGGGWVAEGRLYLPSWCSGYWTLPKTQRNNKSTKLVRKLKYRNWRNNCAIRIY